MADTIFYNADYIVIEYIDILKSPYLILLDQIRKNDKINEILNIDSIRYLDDASLYEWYIHRKHQNFFIDLNRYPDIITEQQLDELLEEQMMITPRFYQDATPLILCDFLKVLKKRKLVKEIIIYHPHKNFFAKNDLENMMKTQYTFMSDFNQVMEKAKENSTYFLSDVSHLDEMKEKGILKFSSVTIPVEYRYNKKNMKDFKYDFDELFKENPFKLSFFRACTFEEPIEGNEKEDY